MNLSEAKLASEMILELRKRKLGKDLFTPLRTVSLKKKTSKGRFGLSRKSFTKVIITPITSGRFDIPWREQTVPPISKENQGNLARDMRLLAERMAK